MFKKKKKNQVGNTNGRSYRFAMQTGSTDSVCDVSHSWHRPSFYLGSLWKDAVYLFITRDQYTSKSSRLPR